MKREVLKQEELWIVIGIPILFFLGAFLHFVYGITGRNSIIGALVPVNESVWEHEKMTVLPIILWWGIFYVGRHKKLHIQANGWFTSAVIALVTEMILMPMIFYFYTQAFQIETVAIDVLILFVCLLAGQMLGLHIYRHSKGVSVWICIGILIIILGIAIVFTFLTPRIELFRDSVTNGYGTDFIRL